MNILKDFEIELIKRDIGCKLISEIPNEIFLKYGNDYLLSNLDAGIIIKVNKYWNVKEYDNFIVNNSCCVYFRYNDLINLLKNYGMADYDKNLIIQTLINHAVPKISFESFLNISQIQEIIFRYPKLKYMYIKYEKNL
jgi:hypothetical protein